MIEYEPDLDVYGEYARASAVADYLELLALQGFQPRRASLADYIYDAAWGSKLREVFLTPDASLEDEHGEGLGFDSEDASGRVFSLLLQRESHLDEDYPFRIAPNEEYFEVTDRNPTPYLALLGITVAHAFGMAVCKNPRDVFEDTVDRALRNAGHRSVNFSRIRRNHSSFELALESAGVGLGIRPSARAAPVSAHAQDAGVDVIAHVASGYSAGDSLGAWTLIGQITCGSSHSWGKKLQEVEVPGWRHRLGSVLPPQAFLAIPHHAEERHLDKLVTNHERMVLDRLRLTRMLDCVSADELTILDAVVRMPMVSVGSDW